MSDHNAFCRCEDCLGEKVKQWDARTPEKEEVFDYNKRNIEILQRLLEILNITDVGEIVEKVEEMKDEISELIWSTAYLNNSDDA